METKKPAKPIERVTINENLKEKLVKLADQANASLQGIANITKSDIINLILENCDDALSSTEIEQLKAAHIDQVKFGMWLASEMRSAKKAGDNVTLKELLERCESSLNAKIRDTRRKKKNKE